MFDNLLRSLRNLIECVYGYIKERWQMLNKLIDLKLEYVLQIVYLCFVLYNFCEINGIRLDDDYV